MQRFKQVYVNGKWIHSSHVLFPNDGTIDVI